MFRKFRPIPCEKFPTDRETITKTNCLAFALGFKNPKLMQRYVLENTSQPIEMIFLKKVMQLGFNSKIFKKIEETDESKSKGYIIRLYGFIPVETDEGVKYDFHLVRREPNGQWVHKPGFGYRPRLVVDSDWIQINEDFGTEFISFEVDP